MRWRPTLLLLVAAALMLAAPRAAANDAVRLAGRDRVATAIAVAQHGWPEGATVAVVATAQDFADALASSALAATHDAPLLLTPGDALADSVAAEVRRLDATDVLVVGGPAAISERVAQDLAAVPGVTEVTRIAGADRFATAAVVANRVGAPAGTVTVASGTAFADAAAAGALSGLPAPVLLAGSHLPPPAATVLERLAPEEALIIGGTAAVSEDVAAEVAARTGGLRRLAGDDRYGTSLAVAGEALGRTAGGSRPLVLATGAAFPDALAAGALTARVGGVLLLVPPDLLPARLDEALRDLGDQLDGLIVVGGDQAVDPFVVTQVEAALAGEPPPAVPFAGHARALTAAEREAMTGVSWRAGCPVALDDLVMLELRHWGFDGEARTGRLVVAAAVAQDVLGVFERIFDAGFPIERMRPIEAYDGDDDRSMAANNTSGFNCRRVTGGSTWSTHAYGTAIDINPVQNPYVNGDVVAPPAGERYVDRDQDAPGMITRPGPVADAFDAIGWGWGGDWRSLKDYQHFSESGR